MNLSMRYENSPNFSSISLLVPKSQHYEVGIFRGKHVFVATIFTTPVHITLSLHFDRVVQFIEIVNTKVNEDANMVTKGAICGCEA